MLDISKIKQTLVALSNGDDLMDYLLEFERVLDNTGMYAYKNWELGELVDGPSLNRHWIKTTWMFPYKKMPDPMAATRLEKIGCKVYIKKDKTRIPKAHLKPDPSGNEQVTVDHFELKEVCIWLVTIEMPLKYITDNIESIQKHIDAELAKDLDSLPDALETGDTKEE